MQVSGYVQGSQPSDHNHELDSEFDSFAAAVRTRFKEMTALHGPLFLTDAADGDLYQVYLDHLPSEHRQHHTCSACRRFIQGAGRLAVITGDGYLESPMWGDDAPGIFRLSSQMMAAFVRRSKVTGVFATFDDVLGTPVTGEWTHFSVVGAKTHQRGVKRAGEIMAQKLQDFGTLSHGLADFKRDVVAQAVTLLQSDALYRAEKVLGPAKFLLDLHDAIKDLRGNRRDNLIWKAVAMAPVGFCTPRSSMVGTLLEDIAAGKSFEDVKRAFASKMHPLQYSRPQVAAKAGNIAQAEKLVEQMGLAASLRRRWARLEDLQTVWTPRPPEAQAKSGGVFGHLVPKDATAPLQPIETPPVAMTWIKFARDALPNALTMRMKTTHGRMNFCAFVTAVDPDAPPILQWDRPEERNPVSTYVYHGGSPASQWGLAANQWVNVTAVALQPDLWGSSPMRNVRGGAVFVMEGARDESNSGLSIFPETLRSELHSIRATIEQFSKNGKLEGGEEASAAGIYVPSGSTMVPIAVTTSIGTSYYSIDRWE